MVNLKTPITLSINSRGWFSKIIYPSILRHTTAQPTENGSMNIPTTSPFCVISSRTATIEPPPPPGHPTPCANQPPCSLQVANSFIKLLKLLCVKSQFSNLQTVRNIRKAISATQRVKERADSEKESARERERSERVSAHCVYAWYAV